MNKNLKVLLIFVFFATFAFDRMTKGHIDWFQSFGMFFFEPHHNSGFILQTLTETSTLARVVFISSLFGFLFFFYFLIQSILTPRLASLRIGLTLLFSSVAGNSFDRAVYGSVSDFICFRTSESLIYFNFADVFMWLGTGITLYSLIRFRDEIWHPDSRRMQFLIYSKYQLKVAFQATVLAFCITLILVLFSYTYIAHVLHSASGQERFMYLVSVVPLGVLFLLVTFACGIIFSHRSAGPLYALERYVDHLIEGKDPHFKLRQSDEFQDLTRLAEKIKKLSKD